MNLFHWTVNSIIKGVSRIICKVDGESLNRIPKQGPLIVAANHVNFLDAPVVISHLQPRPISGLAKKETWDNPFLAFLFNIWDGIPIDRDIADFAAFRKAQEALQAGKILAVAPEGTRSGDGRLIRAKPGITLLAIKSGVPVMPMAYYGHEVFSDNIKRLKRTPMHIRVGTPFKIDLSGHQKNKGIIQDAADAVMLRIAALMPEKYHGFYRGMSLETTAFLEDLD
jgi:1-acyl-sn-glycerol-3-phosphate acyltransferase